MTAFKLQVCIVGSERDPTNFKATALRKHIFLNVSIIKGLEISPMPGYRLCKPTCKTTEKKEILEREEWSPQREKEGDRKRNIGK